jgi:type VI secretion system ImpC/EvpB family protein
MDPKPVADNLTVPVLIGAEGPLRSSPVNAQAEPRRRGGEHLLDDVLRATAPGPGAPGARLDRFLQEPDWLQAIVDWLDLASSPGPVPAKTEIAHRLSRDVARIDDLMARQVNQILHHPSFQKLEASWRGLRYLHDKLPEDDSVKIKVLNVTWNELSADQTRALEFDQSQLFRKVYESEFGHPGGEPFGVLLGDYEMHHRPSAHHAHDDLEVLSKIAGVAAAAFAPFFAGVHPSFFGLDSFTALERSLKLGDIFEQPDYIKWRALRQAEDARFVGLTLPRILMRLPYGAPGAPRDALGLREDVEGPDRSHYLWGNAVYAFGGVLIRSFANSQWLADIRGVRTGVDAGGTKVCLDDGGLVSGLPVHSFATDRTGVAVKCSTDVIITDSQEKGIGELGFIPLCHCYDTEFSVFYGNQSIQKPATYDDPRASANARLSVMLQYMLCVSRFAHYIKVLARDKIGSVITPEECEDYLRKWLHNYVTATENAGPEVKAKYPLREAKVQVRELPDAPGSYYCQVHLRPHYQLDQMFMSVKLSTTLAAGRAE